MHRKKILLYGQYYGSSGNSSHCDITGLNYLSGRYELEHKLHPGKTVLGTETYPADIENLWDKVTTYPHVIGDFTWTGYDYIGEAGVGIFHYDGKENFTRRIHAKVTGNGVLEEFGTADPSSEEDYFSDTVTTFDGSALVVVRWKDRNSKEPAVLRLWTDDEIEVCVNITK